MCRWLAYFGDPIRPEELLYQPGRSLIEQSRRGTPGAAVNNGDGYGMGWYGLHAGQACSGASPRRGETPISAS